MYSSFRYIVQIKSNWWTLSSYFCDFVKWHEEPCQWSTNRLNKKVHISLQCLATDTIFRRAQEKVKMERKRLKVLLIRFWNICFGHDNQHWTPIHWTAMHYAQIFLDDQAITDGLRFFGTVIPLLTILWRNEQKILKFCHETVHVSVILPLLTFHLLFTSN